MSVNVCVYDRLATCAGCTPRSPPSIPACTGGMDETNKGWADNEKGKETHKEGRDFKIKVGSRIKITETTDCDSLGATATPAQPWSLFFAH